MPTSPATWIGHLDTLLITQVVELSCPQLPELGQGLGSVGKQVSLSFGIDVNLNCSIVDSIIDPVSWDLQLHGHLGDCQEAGDLARVRLMAVAHQTVAQAKEPNRAGQNGSAPGRAEVRVVTIIDIALITKIDGSFWARSEYRWPLLCSLGSGDRSRPPFSE